MSIKAPVKYVCVLRDLQLYVCVYNCVPVQPDKSSEDAVPPSNTHYTNTGGCGGAGWLITTEITSLKITSHTSTQKTPEKQRKEGIGGKTEGKEEK
jgi:hypothetical protein